MKELIEYLAKALVDYPEEVRVTELNGGHTSIVELRVSREDRGRVIGREGKTATALRTILSAASSKERKKAFLAIIE